MKTTPHNTIRLLLVSEDEFFRLGVRAVFERTDGFLMDAATTPSTATHMALTFHPHVILVDAGLQGHESLSTCHAILTDLPDARVLVWTASDHDRLAAQADRIGAKGCVPRTISSSDLIQTLRRLAAGLPLPGAVAASRPQRVPSAEDVGLHGLYARLSPQERRLLPLVAQGLINREIASRLSLSEKTIKNYLTSVYIKLGISRRTEAVRLYIQLSAGPAPLCQRQPESLPGETAPLQL